MLPSPSFPALSLLGLVLAMATPASSSSDPSWVEGPPAPTSTAPLPPATAPRETPTDPQDVLVVPPVPPEDARVVADDGLLSPPDGRLTSIRDRDDVARTSALDLDTWLPTAGIPGLWVVPQESGSASLLSRGQPRGGVSVVVDDVPMVDAFGLVSPTEALGLLGAARLSFQHGPRVDAAGTTATGGVLVVDTGGALHDVGESERVDGWLGAGIGGADGEKGAFSLARTGFRRLRIIGHGTVLHRDDLREGRVQQRVPPIVTADAGTSLHTGGAGGTAGARVDVVPFEDSRLFASWQAGRTIDTFRPAPQGTETLTVGCDVVDDRGRPVDCHRVRERGLDLAVVGLDVRRALGGVQLQPSARVHLQRALADVERSGSGLVVVQRSVDEVVRGGARVALAALLPEILLLGPTRLRLDAAVDVYADRVTSTFRERSTRFRDAEPAGDGISDPLRATFVDGAVARTGMGTLALRADTDAVALWLRARLHGGTVDAPALVGRLDDGLATASLQPCVEAGLRVALTSSASWFFAAGQAARPDDPGALLAGPPPTTAPSFRPTPPGEASAWTRFAESGVAYRSPAVDVDAVVYVAAGPGPFVRALEDAGVAALVRGRDATQAGLEAQGTVRPGVPGLSARATLAGVAVDEDAFTADASPQAGVVQPQGSLMILLAPPSSSMALWGRVYGAFPQQRLAPAEEADPRLCPARPEDPAIPQAAPCSGAAGFGVLDVGVSVTLGQLRFDVSGENVFDAQGAWRGALRGTGGVAVRARVAFLF